MDPATPPVGVTWLVYQQMATAYVHPDPREGGKLLVRVIDSLRASVPAVLDELAGRVLGGGVRVLRW